MKAPALVVAVCLAVSGLVAAAPGGTASAAPSADAASTVRWGRCHDSTLRQYKATCGFVTVPLDYSHPRGATIKLAVSRIRHTVSKAKYQGVLLVNPGGPGGSGLTLSVLGPIISNDFGRRDAGGAYDWIGFDPRGVGSSRPALSCDPGYFGPDRPEYVPSTPDLLQAWQQRSTDYAKACGNAGGRLLNHMRTTDSARDMNRIRRALGAKQINYYGFSYGTYLAQVYTKLFPTRMRRMVLDSNVDPRKVWYRANLGQDLAFDRNIGIFFGWIARYDARYHLGTTRSAVQQSYEQVRAQATDAPINGTVGPDEWDDIFAYAGYVQFLWPDLADVFANYVHAGDGAAVVAAYRNFDTPGDDNSYAVYNAVSCVDDTWKDENFLADQWRTYQEAPLMTWANAWFNGPCYHWPAKAAAHTRVTGRGVGRVLLVDEMLDAATPFSGSLYLRSIYRKARLVAVRNGTNHAVTPSGNGCVDNKIFNYLATGKLPPRKSGRQADVTCRPLPQPTPNVSQAFSAELSSGGSSMTSFARLLLAAARP
jgi:pimeloyl-ACP methyl ester carboxylesterase